ncbi:GNAT family N-acetyltransferase [Streptomyces sp. NBC_00209]|uniref:GNAT family N-acetyltransferase n=1 Tax=Streptomyces sp. NBC_00209 TaxID=2975682 RepID=UPI0032558175
MPHPVPVLPELAEAKQEDAPHLACLQVHARGGEASHWAGPISRAIKDGRATVVLARVDGELAGYARATFLPEHPDDGAPSGHYLTGVTVAEGWRRRGIGAALTRWRMAWAWERAAEVWCFVSVQNRASRSLHEALGFIEVQRAASLQGVAFDCGEGLLMRAHSPR